jgi:2-methylcitrate dehydratase PrpD
VNPLAITLESRPEPASGLVGRLSFQHAMAVALVDGAAFPEQFTDARVNDPAVAALRRLIQVEGDDALGPDQCDLTLTLADGRTYTQRVEHASGTPDNPVTDAQLETKFRVLAGRCLPRARVNRLLNALWELENLDNVGDIVKMCRIPRNRNATS